MKESTKKIFKVHGWRVDRAAHYYLYFTCYRIYVRLASILTRLVVRTLSWFRPARLVPQFIFDRYHSKVITSGDVKKILSLNEDLLLGPDTTQRIIPFKYANKIIFREPEYIAVMDCPCKLNRENPCLPLNCCIAVGRPMVDFWLEHCEKYHVRKISREEALDIIREQRQTGHITQAFFKVATEGVTAVFCNCCPKCCVSLEATRLSRKIKGAEHISMNAASGYRVVHDAAVCKRCGECARICPFEAIEVGDETRGYREDLCMGCGLCVEKCPQGALSLTLSEGGLYPLDLDLAREKLGTKSS